MTAHVHRRKSGLRAAMWERLAQLTESQIRSRSRRVCRRLATVPHFAEAESLLVYVSTGHEVATHQLTRDLLAAGRRVSVPYYHVIKRHYVAYQIEDFDRDLSPGKFGILEPKPDPGHVMPLGKFDAVLVPGLAFDACGHRLGRGMGYFDHILSAIQGIRIGLAYDCQIVGEVPTDTHDMHMDFLVTETKLIDCQGTSST
jgi:5-formyltetrahydrofolate cyclo-ligase